MFDSGEVRGTLRHVRPLSLHGTTYYDVTVQMEDGSIQTTRLGPEAVPQGLETGDVVRIRRAGLVVIGIEKESQ